MTELLQSVPPGSILVFGAILLGLLRGPAQKAALLALPVLSFLAMWQLPYGFTSTFPLFDLELSPVRVDRASFMWGTIFHIAAFVFAIYSVHVNDRVQHASALLYAGAAIAAVFAGDLVTLFVWWELTALSSVFLIWATALEAERGEPTAVSARHARRAGLRYLVIQVASGVLLLFGTAWHYALSGSIAFDKLVVPHAAGFFGLGDVALASPGVMLILVAFGMKAAFPFLHNWLQDAYPSATVTGTAWLSAFTTKLAIYALWRAFPGLWVLIPIGLVMTLFPILYAVLENDLRKVLSYSLNNQLGYMVVGIGIGTPLALNGTAAHAFAHILYKGLLFMSMGAVLYRTGTVKSSELGGLYRQMPISAAFCAVGGLSIAGFPLLSGFTTKSMIMDSAFELDRWWLAFGLLIASAGVFHHSTLKVPLAFFGPDRWQGRKVAEAPLNMLIAMGLAAAMCFGIGLYAAPLYELLPFSAHELPEVEYHAYHAAHVLTSLQLLCFAAFGFAVLERFNQYPHELPSIHVDFDVVYRKWAPELVADAARELRLLSAAVAAPASRMLTGGLELVRFVHSPQGRFGEPWPAGTTAMWAAVMLGVYLVAYYI